MIIIIIMFSKFLTLLYSLSLSPFQWCKSNMFIVSRLFEQNVDNNRCIHLASGSTLNFEAVQSTDIVMIINEWKIFMVNMWEEKKITVPQKVQK